MNLTAFLILLGNAQLTTPGAKPGSETHSRGEIVSGEHLPE